MADTCSTRFWPLIDRLLCSELTARKLALLRAHVADCPACRKRYDKVVLASRMLSGGPEALTVPSEGELARVRLEVLDRVAGEQRRSAPAAKRLLMLRWAVALTTTALALAVVVPLALMDKPASQGRPLAGPAGEKHPRHTFQARGPASGAQAATPSGIRAFCIRQQVGDSPRVVGLTSDSAEVALCGRQDVLKFAYTNRSDRRYLFLMGLDEQLAIKWYEPHPPETQSLAIERDVVDQTLNRAVKLGINHAPGKLRLFGLFSDQPLTVQQVEQAVNQARQAGVQFGQLSGLPIGGTDQRTLMVQIVK